LKFFFGYPKSGSVDLVTLMSQFSGVYDFGCHCGEKSSVSFVCNHSVFLPGAMKV
jgi:hypothetical protein